MPYPELVTGKSIIWSDEKKSTIFFTVSRFTCCDNIGFLLHAGAPTIAASGMIISCFDISFSNISRFNTLSFITLKFLFIQESSNEV